MEAKAPLSDTQSASKFVTVLGWLSVVLGALAAVGNVLVGISLLAPDSGIATALGPVDHRTGNGLFWQLLNLIVLVATGIGLVRRRRWALRTGTAVLLYAILQEVFDVAIALLKFSPSPLSLDVVLIDQLAGGVGDPDVLAAYAILRLAFSSVWTGFLFWFFRRHSIRAEFEPVSVAPHPSR